MTVALLACSYIHVIKNQCHSFYTREFTHILLYSTETESKKPLWGGGGEEEVEG